MHDTLAVHMLESTGYLVNVFPNLLLRKRYLVLLSSLHDELQVSLFCPLNSDEQLVQLVIYKPVQVLDYVGVV